MDHIINSITDILRDLPESRLKEVLNFAQFIQGQERIKAHQMVKKGTCNHLDEMTDDVETPDDMLELDI